MNNSVAISCFKKEHKERLLSDKKITINNRSYPTKPSYIGGDTPQFKLFLGGIDTRAKKRNIEQALELAGIPFTKLEMLRDSKTNRFRGCAFVTFESSEDFTKCQLTPPTFMGKVLIVQAIIKKKGCSSNSHSLPTHVE